MSSNKAGSSDYHNLSPRVLEGGNFNEFDNPFKHEGNPSLNISNNDVALNTSNLSLSGILNTQEDKPPLNIASVNSNFQRGNINPVRSSQSSGIPSNNSSNSRRNPQAPVSMSSQNLQGAGNLEYQQPAANLRASHSNVNFQNSPEHIRRNPMNAQQGAPLIENQIQRSNQESNSNRNVVSNAAAIPQIPNPVVHAPANSHQNPLAQSVNNMSINIGRLNNGDININYEKYFFDVMLNVLMTYMFGFGIVGMFVFNMTYFVILALLWGFDIYNIFSLVMQLKIETNNKVKKRLMTLLAEKIMVAVFKTMILIYFETKTFKLLYAIIPIALYCLIRCLIYSLDKNAADCNSIVDFLTIGFRIFLTVQSLTICLKIDQVLTWEWKEVFWTYWVLFSILIGINFGMFLMLSSKLCQALVGDVDCCEIKGLFWFFLLSINITVGSCLMIIGVMEKLDSRADGKLMIAFYFLVGTFSVSGLVSIYLRLDIIKFLKSITTIETEEQDAVLGGNKAQKKEETAPEPIVIPRFLLKFSSTYFKRATDNVPPVKPETKEIKKAEPKKEKTKKNFAVQIASERRFRSTSMADFKSLYNTNLNKSSEGPLNLGQPPGYQNLPKVTENTLVTQNTVGMLSFPDNPNFQFEEEEHKEADNNIKVGNQQRRVMYAAPDEKIKPVNPLEIINFDQKNEKANILHRYEEKEIKNTPQLIFQTTEQNNIQRFKMAMSQDQGVVGKHSKSYSMTNMIRNNNSFVMSARLPETQKILASSRENMRISREKVDSIMESPGEKSVYNCLICFDKSPDAVFMECGHGGVCYDCSLELWKATGECYLCRNKITQVLQIDLKYQNGDYIKVLSSTQMVVEEKAGNSSDEEYE